MGKIYYIPPQTHWNHPLSSETWRSNVKQNVDPIFCSTICSFYNEQREQDCKSAFIHFCKSWGRVDFLSAHVSGPGSSLCCGGHVVQELLPRELCWERRAAGRRACAHWLAAGSHPAACVSLSWRCCVNRPAQSEDAPRTSDPNSPAWCSAWFAYVGPGGQKQMTCWKSVIYIQSHFVSLTFAFHTAVLTGKLGGFLVSVLTKIKIVFTENSLPF